MKNFDLIKRYLDKEMSETEREAFEQKLGEEGGYALKRELETQRIERAAVKLHREDRLRSIIREVKKERLAESPGVRIRKFSFRSLVTATAASVAILLIGGYFLMRGQYSDQSLALSNYDFSVAYLKGGGEQADALDRGKSLFEQAEYQEAIDVLAEAEGYPVQSRYLAGHCYFKMKDFQKAVVQFGEIMQMGDNAGDYETDARWYFVLSKLALGQQDTAFQAALEELTSPEVQDPRAKKLKEQMNSFFR